MDWYLKQYTEEDQPEKHARGKNPRVYQKKGGDWRLTTPERKRILLSHIYGVDIDYQACEVTKLSLLLKVLEGETEETLQRQLFSKERALPDLANNIKCGNSLIGPDFYRDRQGELFDEEETLRINAFDWEAEFKHVFSGKEPGFDAVVGNPPYIRVSNIAEVMRPYFYDHYKINHRFDIYVIFVQKGYELLNSTGCLGFILPNKFITSDYGRSLRRYLVERQALDKIVDFGDAQVFRGATTYTCLLFLSRKQLVQVAYVPSAPQALTDGSSANVIAVPIGRLSDEQWTLVPEQEAAIINKLRRHPPLGRFVDVQHGLQTGMDDVFLLKHHADRDGDFAIVESRAEERPFKLEHGALRSVVKGLADLSRYRIVNKGRLVLFPYETVSGKACLVEEKALLDRYPLAWAYLSRHKSALAKRKGVPAWYAFRRRNYDLLDDIPRILTPSIAQRTSFAIDHTGLIHFVGSGGGGGGGYGINLHQGVDIAIEFFLGLLNSRLLDWLLKKSTSKFHSGYFSYNRQYIEPLPIREVTLSKQKDRVKHDDLVVLVQQMLDLYASLPGVRTDHERTALQRQITATDREIDGLVYQLYGLSDKEIALVEEATK